MKYLSFIRSSERYRDGQPPAALLGGSAILRARGARSSSRRS